MTVTKLTGHVAAELTDVDLRVPLSEETVAALRQGLADHHVLVVRDHHRRVRR